MFNFLNNFQLSILTQFLELKTGLNVMIMLSFALIWMFHQIQKNQISTQLLQRIKNFSFPKNYSIKAIFFNSDNCEQKLVDIVSEAVLIFVQQKCIYINPSGVQLFGADHKEILGKSIFELGLLEDKTNFKQNEVYSTLPVLSCQDYQLIYVETIRFSVTYFQLPALQLILTPKSDLHFIRRGNNQESCIVHSITEPPPKETILKEHYRRLVELSPDGIFVIQNDLISFVNPTFMRMLGASNSDDLIGQPINHFIHSDFYKRILERYESYHKFESKTHFFYEQMIQIDGTEIDVEVSETWTEINGQLSSHFVVKNITERKKIEQSLQIANKKLKDQLCELEERNEEIILLSYMSDLLQGCINLDEAYTVLPQILPLLFPNSSGRVFRLTESKNLLESVAVWGDSNITQEILNPDDCMALRRGQPHLVEDQSQSLLCRHILPPWPAATFCIPMVVQGQATGILHFRFPEKGLLSKPKQQLAITVSRQVSLALANLKLYETLQHQSIRDPLTGLFNRRYLEESLKREIHRSEIKNQTLGIIMIDVDHFKQFNDNFGHDAGDVVLRELGVFIKGKIRETDIACRYGGEELILILPEANLEVTKSRAETIRQNIKNLTLQYQMQSLGSITISVGVACFPEHGLTDEAIIRAADLALYQAKKQGRDQVKVAFISS